MAGKKHYIHSEYTKKRLKVLYITIFVILLVLLMAVGILRQEYNNNIKPVSANTNTTIVTIQSGSSLPQIANTLKQAGVIRSVWAFEWYVRNDGYASQYIEAGTYNLRQSQSVSAIVLELTNGVQASNLVTILPGQRIDQIETSLIRDGFAKSDVIKALQLSDYVNQYSMLQYAPTDATLEGFLYPDSFNRVKTTKVGDIINESLTEMQSKLTPSIVAGFAQNGLNVYQGITIASIVEQEVSKTSDRPIVAQVFISRYKLGMTLGSDVTAYYGSIVAGLSPSLT
ncbi:MAG TPA: endolytic transglycosylase MltG, partial [Candidatus Saccharimonadales bacterium]